LQLDEIRFEPLADKSDNLGLRLFVPGLSDDTNDAVHNALLVALDHGLGERAFAEQVHHTEVVPLAEAPEGALPLTELESFIEWRTAHKG
jgi:hypothetical protein